VVLDAQLGNIGSVSRTSSISLDLFCEVLSGCCRPRCVNLGF